MRVDSEQLAARLERGLAPLYTIVGEEPLLALEAGDRLRAAARAAGHEERKLLVAESGFDWGSLAAEGASLSLFAERRLIELRIPTGKPGTAGAQALLAYCAALPRDTITIVHLPAMDWRAVKAEWFAALDAAGVVVEARPVPRERLPRWLAGRLAGQDQRADEATLAFIADRVEGNLLAAWQEVQKLGLLLPPGTLDAQTVRRAVLDVARFDVAGLCDALLAGDLAHYLRICDGLQGEGAALPLVVWALAADLRSAYALVRVLEAGVPPAQAAREARVFGPRRALVERAARRWDAARLRQALLRMARTDRLAKGLGRGDPWNELRDLGVLLAPAAGPARRPARGAV